MNTCIVEDSQIIDQDYFVTQFKNGSLSQFSYYIESDKLAIIIDPIRDTEIYEKFIDERGSKLKYIIETHLHADFISGHLELLEKTGAEIVYSPNADTNFKKHSVSEGDILNLGKIKLLVVSTPGHTLESISILLLDSNNKEIAIFTGDCLFLGEVGRPDLSVNSNYKTKDMAEILFYSLQKLKRILPNNVIIYPAHGSGSQCGQNIQIGNCDTFGNQKKVNYALADMSKEEFIDRVTSQIQEPPEYYFYDVKLNKSGYTRLSTVIKNCLNPLKPEKFLEFLNEDVIILDVRDFDDALKLFIKGSYILSLKIPFEVWTGRLFSPLQKFVFISQVGKEKDVIKRLAGVGYENILGYLDADMNKFASYCKDLKRADVLTYATFVSPLEVKHIISEGKVDLIDVREELEWINTGIIPGSHLIPLRILEKNISSLIGEDKKIKQWGVFCKTGGRSACALSILKKYDINNVIFMRGIEFMKEHDVELMPYVSK